MQLNKRFRSVFLGSLFVSLFANPFAHTKTSCHLSIKRALAEIYLAKAQAAKIVQDPVPVKVALLDSAKYEILRDSKFSYLYLRIINRSSQPTTRARVLSVLSYLEQHQQTRELQNYKDWLEFLADSKPEEINHRIFEGLEAAILLGSMDVDVAFEPKAGFFTKGAVRTRKSMDIRVSEVSTKKVIGFREVKRTENIRNATKHLISSIGKANVAKLHGPSDAALSTVIFVDPPGLSDSEVYFENDQLEGLKNSFVEILEKDFKEHGRTNLDDVIVVHTELKKYLKFYLDRFGRIGIDEGQIEPFEELDFN